MPVELAGPDPRARLGGAFTLRPRGAFSLAAAIGFLDGFTPAAYDAPSDGVLRAAFPADDNTSIIACALRQRATRGDSPGIIDVEYTIHRDENGDGPSEQSVSAQVARFLSLDVDGTGFPAVGEADPIVARIQADHPGLRPVCFYSPYEAAAWTIIGNRISMTQAAAVKSRLARTHGRTLTIQGGPVTAFPTPATLRGLDHIPGLNDTKLHRLHAIADAAAEGRLDAARLRAQPADRALATLRELPGIGPFSAELILIRGAAHPDIFPTAEPRLHKAMAHHYALDPRAAENPARLAEIAARWRPYRSWVAFLFRAAAGNHRAA